MKILLYALAAALGFLGLVFVVGAQGQPLRIVVGAVLLAGAVALVYLLRLRPQIVEKRVTYDQRIHLSGDVSVERMKCRQCGASLEQESVKVRGGAVFADCGHCGASYQLEEAPKW